MTADDKLREEDRKWLAAQPQFRRHLFEILSASGIYRVTREEQQRLFLEGKRSLGLEILGWFDADNAEPLSAISLALDARTTLKGATNDRSSDRTESE